MPRVLGACSPVPFWNFFLRNFGLLPLHAVIHDLQSKHGLRAMRRLRRLAIQAGLLASGMFVFASLPAFGQCLHFREAKNHIGSTRCIQGKVLRVQEGNRGALFLDFCEDYRACPFTVVVFSRDLKHVGDVRYLQGKDVEIHGPIQEYDGRAEIILSRYKQLRGNGARIPPLPKDYDVEKRGRYSAGTFSHPSSGKKPARKRQGPPVSIEDTSSNGADE
jgi:hypothetical protein